jgi:hypothetical protein
VGGNLQEIEALVKVHRMVAVKHLCLLLGCMVTSSKDFSKRCQIAGVKVQKLFLNTRFKNKEIQRSCL